MSVAFGGTEMKIQYLVGIMGILILAVPGWTADYIDNSNGTVTDRLTGLSWQRQDDGTARIWQEALFYCENLSFAGFDDWRLPDVKELSSITDDSRHTPAIDQEAFPQTKPAGYWTSTPFADNPVFAWFVYFNNGYVNPVNKFHEYYTRCVRGEKIQKSAPAQADKKE